MKYLKPLPLKNIYFADIEEQINAIFDKIIFNHIRRVLNAHNKTLRNATGTNALVTSIEAEAITYLSGAFYGAFNSKISKQLAQLGAVFDRRKKAWIIPEYKLPLEVQRAIRSAELQLHLLRTELLGAINDIDINQVPLVDYTSSIHRVHADLAKTIEAISKPTKLSPASERIIAKEWAENLDLYIKNWVSDDILKLRQIVQSNTLMGGRAEALHGALQQNYHTSKNKAKFLARQETSLLVSKIREQEYKEIGITRYKWSVVGGEHPDERVRELHKLLNGHIFSFDDPPASGTNGEKQNPGEPFGCRCLAIPIVESALLPE